MKMIVDQDLCIECGQCIDLCPEVFDWNDDGKAQSQASEIDSDNEACAMEAAENCPTDAILEA
ncbi:MAG: ferredoxin [Firmicutes bacterium]|nr:ferredoxin [Bacillota bacterium]